MTEWQTLSARFTDEEMKIIRQAQAKQGITDNQLIRQAVHLAIGMLSVKDALEEPNLSFFHSYAKEVKKIMNSPKYQKMMETMTKEIATKYKEEQIKQFEKEVKHLTYGIDVFNKKRKRGPKPIKRKVGRPKDTGA